MYGEQSPKQLWTSEVAEPPGERFGKDWLLTSYYGL